MNRLPRERTLNIPNSLQRFPLHAQISSPLKYLDAFVQGAGDVAFGALHVSHLSPEVVKYNNDKI